MEEGAEETPRPCSRLAAQSHGTSVRLGICEFEAYRAWNRKDRLVQSMHSCVAWRGLAWLRHSSTLQPCFGPWQKNQQHSEW